MWPYSAEENEWLNPQRWEPASPTTGDAAEPRSRRIAWHLEHARQLRAEATAAFMRSLFDAPRRLLTKYAPRLRGVTIGGFIRNPWTASRGLRTKH